LRNGALPIWILTELRDGPSYGYELLQRLESAHGKEAPVGPSALYPALAGLRAGGLVLNFYGSTSRGPIRKYYDLTQEGRALLPEIDSIDMGIRQIANTGEAPSTSIHDSPGNPRRHASMNRAPMVREYRVRLLRCNHEGNV